MSAIISVLLFVAIGGCGNELQTYPLTGTIVLSDGTPLTGACISLEALDGSVTATAISDERGEFSMGTFKAGDGVPAGAYRAVVTPPVDPDAKLPLPPRFHPRYRRYETSGLEFTARESANHWEIKLDSP